MSINMRREPMRYVTFLQKCNYQKCRFHQNARLQEQLTPNIIRAAELIFKH